jgi:predicted PP-loop superfamily ATPase
MRLLNLVDGLLAHTQALMMEQPLLPGVMEDKNDTYMRHVVAFSGGIDSTLVLALLVKASKSLESMESTTAISTRRESVHAVNGISPAVSWDRLGITDNGSHWHSFGTSALC